MRATSRQRLRYTAALMTTIVVTVSACGSSGSAGSSSATRSYSASSVSSSTSAAAPALTAASSGPTAAESSQGSQSAVDAAKATTKTYTDNPSAFPVTDPLPSPLPAGTSFAYLQCGAPVCAQETDLLRAAAAVTNSKFDVVKAGASAQEQQNAMSSLIALKPSALLLPSLNPDTVAGQIKQAQQQNIPIAMGIIDGEPYGIKASTFGRALVELAGKLMADWVVANEPSNAKIVFYTIPELNFTPPEEAAFRAEVQKGCPGCTVRTVKTPIATTGSTAPSLVVSDLEGHPDTTVAVFSANDTTTGLAPALKTAGLTTPYIAFGPTVANLVDIKSGAQAAGLGLDYNVLSWTFVDEGSRLILNAPLSADEKKGLVPVQWLTKGNLTGDYSKGWTAYPDYVERFTKLWKVG